MKLSLTQLHILFENNAQSGIIILNTKGDMWRLYI